MLYEFSCKFEHLRCQSISKVIMYLHIRNVSHVLLHETIFSWKQQQQHSNIWRVWWESSANAWIKQSFSLLSLFSRWVLMSWFSCALTSLESVPTTPLRFPRDKPSRRPEDTSRPDYICRGRISNRYTWAHMHIRWHQSEYKTAAFVFGKFLIHRT